MTGTEAKRIHEQMRKVVDEVIGTIEEIEQSLSEIFTCTCIDITRYDNPEAVMKNIRWNKGKLKKLSDKLKKQLQSAKQYGITERKTKNPVE